MQVAPEGYGQVPQQSFSPDQPVGSEKVLASLKTMKIPASVMDVLDDSFVN